jgi:tetratricopeptide (TPR) repeat protein
VLDLITSLVEKSLLRVEEGDEGARYRMLETIRDYANEKLILRDEQVAFAAAHAEHFLAIARAGISGMESPEQAQWMRRLEDALDDMRAAISLSLGGSIDPILSVRFEAALMGFWLLRGYVTEGRNFVRASLALQAVLDHQIAHGHALYVGAALADSQGFTSEAQRMLDECLALRRNLDTPFDLAATLSTRSLVMLHAGHPDDARRDESEAVSIFRELEHSVGESMALLHLGQIEAYVDNVADAREYLEQAIAIARSIGHAEVEGEGELTLGQIELRSGDLPKAVARFERSEEVCTEAEDKRGQASAMWWLGKVALLKQEFDGARLRLRSAMRTFHAFEMNAELTPCMEDFGELLATAGSAELGVKFLGAAESMRNRMALPRSLRDEERWMRTIARARERSGTQAFDAAFMAGQSWATGDAVDCALAADLRELVAA